MDAMKRRPTAILEDQQPDTAYVMDSSGQGLHAQFNRSRVIGGAVAIAAVIGTIMIVLQGDGVRIQSFFKEDKSDDAIKTLLDRYNSVSGSIGSFITKPIEFFLGVLVSAAFLCFATDFTLSKSNDGHWKYIPVLVGAAIAYSFSNGLNALNVQVVSGKVDILMGIDDLTTDSVSEDATVDEDTAIIFPNGSIPMPWSIERAETAEANDVLNTILRTMMKPTENSPSMCNSTGYKDVLEPFMASTVVTFGFPARQWHIDVLTRGAKPVKELKVAMNQTASDLPSDSALPSSANVSRGLVNVGVRVLNDLFHGTNQTINPTVPTAGTFMAASHATWLSALNVTKGALPNDATVEYSRFEFSDKITYDAVTLELSVAYVQRDKLGTIVNPVNGSNELFLKDYCSREGCLILPAQLTIQNKSSTVQPRVQVTTICLNEDDTENELFSLPPCDKVSLSSMRVVSIGTRIVGDVWDLSVGNVADVMRFKNLRTVYSITVARLGWETENLADAFGAKCVNSEDKGGCTGLRLNLTPEWPEKDSDYLSVGFYSLPIIKLSQFTGNDYDKWVYLVTGADGLGGEHLEILRPRNFANVTASGASLRTIPTERCNTFADDYIRAVELNHLYMEHSLQVSYTSALLYLFQNSVPIRRMPLDKTTTSMSKKSPLTSTKFGTESIPEFKANKQVMDVMVSVPTFNVFVSLFGCLVVLAVSVGVVMRAEKSEQLLQERADVAIVTEAMLNSSKYPPWLLNLALEQAAAAYTQEQQEHGQPPQEERVRVLLQDLRVQSVSLQHNSNADHTFQVGSDVYKA